MNKIKYILGIIIFSLLVNSCRNNRRVLPIQVQFDHAAQAAIDKDSLINFLENNYYNETEGLIKPLIAGETALYDDSRLTSKNVTETINGDEIEFIMYYYTIREGNPIPVKGNPTVMDSVLTKYSGYYIKNKDTLVHFETPDVAKWFTLNGVVRGWTYGFVHFKGGENITDNGPITYTGGGKGILFIPSGLGYKNTVEQGGLIPGNSILIFYIDLFDLVENTDHDNDGVPSIFEDPDGDGDPRNDDTDGDLIPNFLDTDDDGDGTLTRNEDANEDGDPSNDFNDPDNPELPDYLNPNIK